MSLTGIESKIIKLRIFAKNFSAGKRWNFFEYIFLLTLLGIAVLQSFYGFFSWSDPVDNILGGQLILRGLFPYVGFFSHHMPFPYFLSAIFSFVSHNHLEVYRLLFTLSLFAILLMFIRWSRNHVGRIGAWFGAALIVLTSGYTLMYVPLAETIVSYIVLILFSFFVFRFFSSSYHITRHDVCTVSLLLFMVVMSSLAYIFFAIAIGVLFIITIVLKNNYHKIKHFFFVTGVLLAPYLVFLVALLGFGVLGIFVEQVYTFNQVYYAPFVPEAITVIGWASQPLYNFLHIHILALGSHGGASVFAMYSLSTIVAAVAASIVRKKYYHLVLVLISAFLLLPRLQASLPFGNPGDVLHAGPFIFFLAFISAVIVVPATFSKNMKYLRIPCWFAMIFTVVVIFTSLYGVSGLPNLISKYKSNSNQANFANTVNALVGPNEYYWAGPYPYEDALLVRGKPATRYIFYYPWQAQNPSYRQEVLQQLRAHSPRVVYFNYDLSVWGYPVAVYASDVLQFLNGAYFHLENESHSAKYIFFRNDIPIPEATQALQQDLTQ